MAVIEMIFNTFIGAFGVVLTIYSIRKNRKLKSVTWEELHIATKIFWRKLNHKKIVPTFIITPGQKGGIIAQLISDFYDEEIPVLTGFIEPKNKERIPADDSYLILTTSKWYVYMPIYLKNYEQKDTAKLLIVDDFAMSGDFLCKLKDALLNLGYLEENIYSYAVAVTKVALDAKKAPNYHWKIVDDKDFYFPWGKAK